MRKFKRKHQAVAYNHYEFNDQDYAHEQKEEKMDIVFIYILFLIFSLILIVYLNNLQ